VFVSERIDNRVRDFRIGDRVDSDHMSLEMTLEVRQRRGQGKKIQKQGRKKTKELETIIWNQETKEKYAERTGEMCRKERAKWKELMTIEEKWERLKGIVHEAMVKKRIKIERKRS